MSKSITCPNCQYGISIEQSSNLKDFKCPSCSFRIELLHTNETIVSTATEKYQTLKKVIRYTSLVVNVALLLILLYVMLIDKSKIWNTNELIAGWYIIVVLLFTIFNLFSKKVVLKQVNITLYLFLFIIGASLMYDSNSTGIIIIVLSSLSMYALYLKK